VRRKVAIRFVKDVLHVRAVPVSPPAEPPDGGVSQEDPVMRRFHDAQHDTIADRRDSDVKIYNGWRSLPIVYSGSFARCAVFVRSE
jgi:hypothetical protein